MKVTLTFTNGEDLAKVDKDDIYRTYFEFPDEILPLSDFEQQMIEIANSIDLMTRAYLFVTCHELNWINLPIRHADISQKRNFVEFSSVANYHIHNHSTKGKQYQTLKILGVHSGTTKISVQLYQQLSKLLKAEYKWEVANYLPYTRDKSIWKKSVKRMKVRTITTGKQQKKGCVYFIQQGENGAIKIGYSTNPEKRLKTLSTASPYPLYMRLIIEGGKNLERDLHDKFAEYQMDGEWFEACTPLLEFIQNQQLDES